MVAPLSNAANAAQQQLLSQAAPHVLLAATGALQGQSIASGGSGTAAIPVQHLLIPVSIGNGLQQLISIPLSLAAGAGNQIQLLATSSGQLIATNMAAIQPPTNSIVSLSGKYVCIDCMWWLSLTPLRELNVPAYTEFPPCTRG